MRTPFWSRDERKTQKKPAKEGNGEFAITRQEVLTVSSTKEGSTRGIGRCLDRRLSVDSLWGSSFEIGTIQRRLAWPLRKDDTHTARSVNNSILIGVCLWHPYFELEGGEPVKGARGRGQRALRVARPCPAGPDWSTFIITTTTTTTTTNGVRLTRGPLFDPSELSLGLLRACPRVRGRKVPVFVVSEFAVISSYAVI